MTFKQHSKHDDDARAATEKKAISICHFRFHLGRLWLFWDRDFSLFCFPGNGFAYILQRRWNFSFRRSRRNKMIKREERLCSTNENSACCHVCSRFSPRTPRRDMKAENVLKESERSSLLYGNPESAQGAPKEIKQFLSSFQNLLTWRLLQVKCNLALNPFIEHTEKARIQFHLASSYLTFLLLALIDLVN